jgi:hypothetical protein
MLQIHQKRNTRSCSPKDYDIKSIDFDADGACREEIVAWCFEGCGLYRDSVEMTLSPQGAVALTDRKVFQLAAMASQYTAVKIHEIRSYRRQKALVVSTPRTVCLSWCNLRVHYVTLTGRGEILLLFRNSRERILIKII